MSRLCPKELLAVASFSRRAAEFLLVVAVLFLDATVQVSFAQNRANVVFWDEKEECGSRKLTDDSIRLNCKSAVVNAEKIYTIENETLTLSVLPSRGSARTVLYVKVENKGKKKFEFDPAQWSIAHYGSEEEFKQGKLPILNETSLVPPKPSRVTTVSSSSQDPFGSPSSRTVTTISDGRGDVTRPNLLPPGQQQTVTTPRNDRPGVSTTTVSGSGSGPLRAGLFKTSPFEHESISVKERVSGTVSFNRIRESGFQLGLIHIGETTFAFPIRF